MDAYRAPMVSVQFLYDGNRKGHKLSESLSNWTTSHYTPCNSFAYVTASSTAMRPLRTCTALFLHRECWAELCKYIE